MVGDRAREQRLRGLPAANVEDHLRRQLEPGQAEGGVDTAFEAIACVAVDAELAAGLGDIERVPKRQFDQHLGRALVAARGFSAHDAADQFDAALVGDHHHALVERVGLAVEREERLTLRGAAHRDRARDLLRVEDVQRPPAIERHVVGDVDKRVDRAKADRSQPPLHEGGRGTAFHAAHETQRESRAELRVGGREIELHRDGTGKAGLHRRDRLVLEPADARGREIASDAVDGSGVGAVRREVDLDHRIVEPGIGREGGAERCVFRQIDDALVIVGNFELGLGDEHAVRFDAADHALAERDLLARNIASRRGEHAHHPGAGVRRAAHDLHRIAPAGVDDADAKPVGIRMLLRLDDARDGEGRERGPLVLDRLDLEADARQHRHDLVERGLGLEMILEPGQGELHGRRPQPPMPSAWR